MSLPDTCDELLAAIDAAPDGAWVSCSAWAVGGGDFDDLDIRLQGGRAVYTNAWCVMSATRDRVRISRLDSGDDNGPREVVRYVEPDAVVETRRRQSR